MRFQFVLLMTAAATVGFSAAGGSQENSPAVTDFTMAEVLSIQTDDIIEPLFARGSPPVCSGILRCAHGLFSTRSQVGFA
jgi:hypothetical protein